MSSIQENAKTVQERFTRVYDAASTLDLNALEEIQQRPAWEYLAAVAIIDTLRLENTTGVLEGFVGVKGGHGCISSGLFRMCPEAFLVGRHAFGMFGHGRSYLSSSMSAFKVLWRLKFMTMKMAFARSGVPVMEFSP